MQLTILLIFAMLFLTGCAQDYQGWPTVAFSGDLKDFERTSAAHEAVLAPLPTLSESDRAGIESPELYWQQLIQSFSDLKKRLEDGFNKLRVTERNLAASNRATNDLRLATELQLSSLSLMIEELPIIRARAHLLSQVTSESSQLAVLSKDAESLEITYRALLLQSRLP